MDFAGDGSYQLLATIFDDVSELVFAQDATERTVFTNQSLRDFLGIDQGQPDLREIENAFNSLIQSESTTGTDLLNQSTFASVENANGEIRTLRRNHKQVTLANGESYRVGIYTDLTSLSDVCSTLKQQKKKLEEKSKAMDALSTVAVELINRVDLQSLLQHAVNNAGKITSADYSFLAMVNESGEYLETTVASTTELKEHFDTTLKRGEGLSGAVWKSGKTLIVSDYKNHPVRLQGREFVLQAAAVPIKNADEVVGVLGVAYRKYHSDIEYQVDVLEKFAQLLSVAIENKNLHENTKSELIRTAAISELSQEIHSATDLTVLLDGVCTRLVSAFRATKAHIYRYQDNSGFAPLIAWEKCNDRILPAKQAGPDTVAGSVATWCIQNQETAFIKRGVDDSRETTQVHQSRRNMRLGSTVCVPLVHKNKPWGVLYAHRRIEQQDFNENDINLFKIVGSQTSIALHRHDLLDRVQHQAYHDSLTGLPNRLMFESRLHSALENHSDKEKRLAVLYLDLDGFKTVNDSHGHTLGDQLLQIVATRLRNALKASDTLARMGGDEFAIIIPHYRVTQDVLTIANRLLDTLSREAKIDGARVQISASIGINYYSDDASSASELLKNSDIAMYNAKNLGKGFVSVFAQADAWHYQQRLAMEQDLRTAIREAQFELYYQPKVSCHTKKCDRVEALIRWLHPEKGIVSPLDFIAVAEECGLIQEIGTWVIDEACRQGAEFVKAGKKISIAVNISAAQFARDDFVETVFQLLEQHNYPSELLELEVTESVVMKDIEIVVSRLTELRESGIKIAIDDFGTGYSSLKYLEDLPLDVLKIDKAFVDKLDAGKSEQSLVKTIVLMAGSFNLSTVAEGVETEEQVAYVEQLGCDYIQGYVYSKPLAAVELPAVLDRINRQPARTRIAVCSEPG